MWLAAYTVIADVAGPTERGRAFGGVIQASTRGSIVGAFIGFALLNAELVTVNTSEGAAYGAALLAGVGAGGWDDVASACTASVKITGSIQPIPAQVEAYQKAYEVYQELYLVLKSTFGKL